MTREEAIERFENVKANALVQKASGVSVYWQNEIDGTVEAIDMAIEALQESEINCVHCPHYHRSMGKIQRKKSKRISMRGLFERR